MSRDDLIADGLVGMFTSDEHSNQHRHNDYGDKGVGKYRMVCGDIVDSPLHKELYLVGNVRLCAYHDDRCSLNLRQNLLSRYSGEHEIKKNEIGMLVGQKIHSLGTRIGTQGCVALGSQKFFDHITNVDIVVDDGNGLYVRLRDVFSYYNTFSKR